MHKKINSMTLAAIFAAIYLVISALSLAFPFLDGIILVIMPIFATYYAAIYKTKEILLFNLATLLLCFLVTISDPFFSILYIFPTLVVGDLFGLLIKKRVPYYTSFFILSIIYLLTNLFSFYLTKVFYDIDLLQELFQNEGFIQNFSFTFLLFFSMLEAFCCQKIICNELKKFHLSTFYETSLPTYYFIIVILFLLLTILFLFLWTNLYLLCFFFVLSLSIFSIKEALCMIKHKSIIILIGLVALFLAAIPLLAFQKYLYLPLLILIPNLVFQIVYFCQILYNKKRKNLK